MAVRCMACDAAGPSTKKPVSEVCIDIHPWIEEAITAWNRRASQTPTQETGSLGREEIIEIVMRETTDEVVADGWDKLGKPNVLVQGCRYIRGHAPGYENPEEAAHQFAGYITDAILAKLSASQGVNAVGAAEAAGPMAAEPARYAA